MALKGCKESEKSHKGSYQQEKDTHIATPREAPTRGWCLSNSSGMGKGCLEGSFTGNKKAAHSGHSINVVTPLPHQHHLTALDEASTTSSPHLCFRGHCPPIPWISGLLQRHRSPRESGVASPPSPMRAFTQGGPCRRPRPNAEPDTEQRLSMGLESEWQNCVYNQNVILFS